MTNRKKADAALGKPTPWPEAEMPPQHGHYNCGGRYVPALTPETLAAVVPGHAVTACPDCRKLGHICRPCRAARYDARHANRLVMGPDVRAALERDDTPWWFAVIILGAVITLASLAAWVVYG